MAFFPAYLWSRPVIFRSKIFFLPLFLILLTRCGYCQVSNIEVASGLGDLIERNRESALKLWDADICKLEDLDRSQSDPDGALLLIGSSSMVLWKSAAEDLAPYPVINRGYGGAKFSDLVVFADRLVRPHNFRAVLIFVGNDVVGNSDDRTAEEVGELARSVIKSIRQHNAVAPVFIIEITPTGSRFAVWDQIRQSNTALRELCLVEPNTYFIETAEAYLTVDNQPRDELFIEDRLHQNATGYHLWGKLIRNELDQVLKHCEE